MKITKREVIDFLRKSPEADPITFILAKYDKNKADLEMENVLCLEKAISSLKSKFKIKY